jgi:hypothetical protein
MLALVEVTAIITTTTNQIPSLFDYLQQLLWLQQWSIPKI